MGFAGKNVAVNNVQHGFLCNYDKTTTLSLRRVNVEPKWV